MIDEKNSEKSIVSVIIPTCNRPPYLKKCIDSVLMQTYQNFEILVVDNSTEKFIKKNKEVSLGFNDSRVKYFRIGQKNGAQESRNFGINNAKGRYLAFIDDDDEWVPEKLEEQLKFFDDLTALVSCKTQDSFEIKNLSPKFQDLIKKYTLGTTSTFVIKKDVLIKVGLFDINCPAAQDHELGLRISKNFKVKIVPLVLVKRNTLNNHIGINFIKRIRGHLYLFTKYSKNYSIIDKIKFICWILILLSCLILNCKTEKYIKKIQEWI